MRENLGRRETLLVGSLMYLNQVTKKLILSAGFERGVRGLWGNNAKTQEKGDAVNTPSVWNRL